MRLNIGFFLRNVITLVTRFTVENIMVYCKICSEIGIGTYQFNKLDPRRIQFWVSYHS